MNNPTPAQLKKLEKLAKVIDGGDIALLTQLTELEERVDTVLTTAEEAIQVARETKKMKGDDGRDGVDGKDYILTAQDKKEIASKITVPVVEKVIEKTVVREVPGETIIREIPIVTNEIKEVATLDDAIVGYLEDEIKRVEELIPEVVEQRETNFGFVIRDVVAGTGVTIDKSDPNRPVVSATGGPGSSVWGGITGTLSDQTDLNSALSGKSDTGHTHTGIYEPAKGADDNYVTDAEKSALHSHSNKTALDNVSGVNTGDQDLSGYSLTSHNHTGVYAPVLGVDDNYVTDAEKTKLSNLSGTNTGDQTIKDCFGITVDGAGTALTTGSKGLRYIEQNCTITGWHLSGTPSGSIVFDVKRSGVSIAGSEKPTLSSQTSNSDLSLTTWTTSLSAGDIIEFVIDSASTITRATLTIVVTK